MVSKESYDAVRKVMDLAGKRGMDPIEALDRASLLLTPERQDQIIKHTLIELWHRLDAQRPSDIMMVFLGHNAGTPDDMYRALLDWLEAIIRDREGKPE